MASGFGVTFTICRHHRTNCSAQCFHVTSKLRNGPMIRLSVKHIDTIESCVIDLQNKLNDADDAQRE